MGESDWLSCRICRLQTSKCGAMIDVSAEKQIVQGNSLVISQVGLGHINEQDGLADLDW